MNCCCFEKVGMLLNAGKSGRLAFLSITYQKLLSSPDFFNPNVTHFPILSFPNSSLKPGTKKGVMSSLEFRVRVSQSWKLILGSWGRGSEK